MLSYNQIITKFQEFAEAHYFLKSFGTGEAWQVVEHNKLKNRKYPMMWVEDLPFPYSTSEVVYSFRVYFLAQVAVLKNQTADTLEQTNVVEVKSDMLQCANDLLSYWVQDHNYDELDIDKSTTAISFNQEFNDNLTGWYIDIKLSQAIKYNSCAIPMSGVTPPPSEDCDPVSITLNLTSLTDTASGGTKTITITYANGDPVVVTTVTDTANTFVGTVPDIPTVKHTALPMQTGQTTSYRSGDDGTDERGRLTDWWNLPYTNHFNHSKRFTGIYGGYQDETTGNYFDKDGNASDRATEFPNEVIIDWGQWNVGGDTVFTFFFAHRAASIGGFSPSADTWDDWIDNQPYTDGGSFFTDWSICNVAEAFSILNHEMTDGARPYGDRPLLAPSASTSTTIYTSTGRPNVSTQAFGLFSTSVPRFTEGTKTSSRSTILCRYSTLTEIDNLQP